MQSTLRSLKNDLSTALWFSCYYLWIFGRTVNVFLGSCQTAGATLIFYCLLDRYSLAFTSSCLIEVAAKNKKEKILQVVAYLFTIYYIWKHCPRCGLLLYASNLWHAHALRYKTSCSIRAMYLVMLPYRICAAGSISTCNVLHVLVVKYTVQQNAIESTVVACRL